MINYDYLITNLFNTLFNIIIIILIIINYEYLITNLFNTLFNINIIIILIIINYDYLITNLFNTDMPTEFNSKEIYEK